MEKKFNNDYYEDTDYFCQFNLNPTYDDGKRYFKPDCVIRAFAVAADITWLKAFDLLCANARKNYTVPNGKDNYDVVFKDFGFVRNSIKVVKGKPLMTVEDFCKRNPKGRFILRLANHLTPVVDGICYDNWNPATKSIYFYYQLI